jgi:copper(I)-binding protein
MQPVMFRFAVWLVGCGALLSLSPPASAHDYTAGALQIAHPWMRATPKGATVAGGYMAITNKGAAPDRLLGGSTPVADRFEVHKMEMDQGVAKMRPVEGGLEIKPGETVELKPGSFHIMLMGLKQALEQGQRLKGTLQFERAGEVEIEYDIEGLGAPGPTSDHSH